MAGRKSTSRKSTSRKSTSRKSTSRKSTSRKSMRRKSSRGGGRRKSRGSTRSTSSRRKKTSVDKPFEPTTLNISSIGSYFLLLRSHERAILLKALNTIHHYLKYHFDEVSLMYESTHMDDVKQLSQIGDQFIPESSLRLLALVSKDAASHRFLTADEGYIKFLSSQYISESDVAAKHSSSILANLTNDVDFAKSLADLNFSGFDLKSLISSLGHANADVCHNTMLIIGNIFQDLTLAEKFVNLKEFSYAPLFDLLDSDYIEVQKKALTLIQWLGCHKKTTELKDRFIDQNGVAKMFSVLNEFQWRDIHPQVLEVLRTFLETDEERIRTIERKGVEKFIWYIDYCEDDTLIAQVLGNILDIASTVFGKLELVELGFVSKVTAILSDGTPEMKLEACYIINEMLKNVETVRLFTELAPIPELLAIILEQDYTWDLKGAALGVLHNLTKFSADMAYLVAKQPHRGMFKRWIQKNLLHTPQKYKDVVYDVLGVLVQHSLVRPQVLEFGLVWAFLLGLLNTDPQLSHIQLVSAEALFFIIPEEQYARQYIVICDGMRIVARALFKAKDHQLMLMLCNVVRVAAECDEKMLISLFKMGMLKWLVKRRQMWSDCEPMEWAATALQNQFLPMKFEYRGRLTFNDVTKNGFYIRRQYDSPEKLPVPPELADDDGHTPYTIYIANLVLKKDLAPEKLREEYSEKLKHHSILDEKCVSTFGFEFDDSSDKDAPYDLSEEPMYIRKCEENCIRMEDDPRLISIYEDVENRLKQGDKQFGPREYSMPFDHSWVLSRVEVLVDVIFEAMAGTTGEPCYNHSIDLYVEELKMERDSNVISLGRMEKGGSLERALLFKILADKIGLPCSLWRGAHGGGWNEIALLNLGKDFPQRNKDEQKIKTEDKAEMPTRLIYPTHVVDLMVQPRRLIEVGSPEADHYTGRPIKSVLHKVPESEPPPIDTCLIWKSREA